MVMMARVRYLVSQMTQFERLIKSKAQFLFLVGFTLDILAMALSLLVCSVCSSSDSESDSESSSSSSSDSLSSSDSSLDSSWAASFVFSSLSGVVLPKMLSNGW